MANDFSHSGENMTTVWPTATTGADSPPTKIETSCPTASPRPAVSTPTSAPAAPRRRSRARSDALPVLGPSLVDPAPEGPAGELQALPEQTEHLLDAAVVAGQRSPARRMPHDVVREHAAQGVQVALLEGRVSVAHKLLV